MVWKGRRLEKEREREWGNKGDEEKWGEAEEKKRLRLEAEDQFASANREGVGLACVLKGQYRPLQN